MTISARVAGPSFETIFPPLSRCPILRTRSDNGQLASCSHSCHGEEIRQLGDGRKLVRLRGAKHKDGQWIESCCYRRELTEGVSVPRGRLALIWSRMPGCEAQDKAVSWCLVLLCNGSRRDRPVRVCFCWYLENDNSVEGKRQCFPLHQHEHTYTNKPEQTHDMAHLCLYVRWHFIKVAAISNLVHKTDTGDIISLPGDRATRWWCASCSPYCR